MLRPESLPKCSQPHLSLPLPSLPATAASLVCKIALCRGQAPRHAPCSHHQHRRSARICFASKASPEGNSSKGVVTTVTAAVTTDPETVANNTTTTAILVPAAANSARDDAWRWEESDDAVLAYGSLVTLLALGNVPALHNTKLADLPYFVGLAVVTIYIGAHRGLTTRQRQQISIKEGILAPVLASVSLFGFYLLIKYLPDFNVQAFLNAYFWMLGTFAISGAAVPILRKVGGPLGERSLKFDVPEGWLLDEAGGSIRKAELAPMDLVAVALALGLSTAELVSEHTAFSLNNLVATLVATDILQLIGPRSFRTAGLLLLGLLLYDVFWVFGSPKVVGDNVMLTVATSDLVSGPTRILFPRVPGGGSTAEAAAAAFPFSLLGLGDIAIPGLLACLALRYDASRSTDMHARAVAAAEAITSVLAALDPGATSRQIADATADAAEAAYDRVAEQEARQRTESLDGTNAGGGGATGDDGSALAAAAARSFGASLARGVSVAAGGGSGGSTSLGSVRSALGGVSAAAAASMSGAGRSPDRSGLLAGSASQDYSPSAVGGGDGALSSEQQQLQKQQQLRLPVSEAVLHQRTYFTPIMFAYVFGLVGAFVANDITGLGQPALLYIVPATLGAVVLTGLRRGELGRLWNFTDVPSYGLSVSGNDSGGGSGNKEDGKEPQQH